MDGHRETSSISPAELAVQLYDRGLLKTWARDRPEGWTLVSGLWSPFYLQLRHLASHPDLMRLIGRALADRILEEVPAVTRLVGVAMAGVPIATAASLSGNIPCAFTRKLEGVRDLDSLRERIKEYGDHSMVEGELAEDDVIVIVDDLVTRFGSKTVAMDLVARELQRRGIGAAKVPAVAVVVDREQGAQEEAEGRGVDLISFLRFKTDCLGHLEGVATMEEIKVLRDYLTDPVPFQERALQEELRTLALG